MEQRPLRLGDILDDYCPRERRVTNHAVVAMIEDTVKQTRCTTCDAEHPYKGGQAPRRRKKDSPTALYKEVLAGKPEPAAAPVPATAEPSDPEALPVITAAEEPTDDFASDEEFPGDDVPDVTTPEPEPAVESPILADAEDRAPDAEDGPVHRPLIRATLPRPEGQKDARTPPDFTIRQTGGRGNNVGNQFRPGNRTKMRTGGGHSGNGHRPHGGTRFSGARPGQGQGRGQGGGFRSAQQPRHGGGGRKRSR
jgi:hypothetical protein